MTKSNYDKNFLNVERKPISRRNFVKGLITTVIGALLTTFPEFGGVKNALAGSGFFWCNDNGLVCCCDITTLLAGCWPGTCQDVELVGYNVICDGSYGPCLHHCGSICKGPFYQCMFGCVPPAPACWMCPTHD
jgi:hypothetical protein